MMKKSTIPLLLILTSVVFWGCKGSLFTITPEGDKATLTIEQRPALSAELLAINKKDSILYVDVLSVDSVTSTDISKEIIGIKLNAIRSITIQNYTNKEWVIPWVAFQIVPPVLLVIAASQAGADNIGRGAVILGLPGLFSGLLLISSTPDPPEITPDFTTAELDELNKYTRYPLGLSNKQLQELIRIREQKEIRVIGETTLAIQYSGDLSKK